jgi:hypothetical protein
MKLILILIGSLALVSCNELSMSEVNEKVNWCLEHKRDAKIYYNDVNWPIRVNCVYGKSVVR